MSFGDRDIIGSPFHNTMTTVASVKNDLKGWQLSRCVFVGDAGMVSAQNLAALARAGGKYIVCMPIQRGSEIAREVITRPGRYQQVAENLQVKEVVVGDGERRRRYVVCHNPQEAERQARHREAVLTELAAEIECLHEANSGSHSKRVCELRASGRYGRYIRLTPSGHPRIDQANVQVPAAGRPRKQCLVRRGKHRIGRVHPRISVALAARFPAR